jgi:hypothetical protein
MSLAADLMILIGAILLTFGTDLVISSASAPATVGAPARRAGLADWYDRNGKRATVKSPAPNPARDGRAALTQQLTDSAEEALSSGCRWKDLRPRTDSRSIG